MWYTECTQLISPFWHPSETQITPYPKLFPLCSIIYYHHRNMTSSERPSYTEILKVLTSKKEDVLAIPPEEVEEGHSLAMVLGAPLEAGKHLYDNLQHWLISQLYIVHCTKPVLSAVHTVMWKNRFYECVSVSSVSLELLQFVSILKVLVEMRGSVQRSSQDSSLAVSWHIFRRYSQ